MAGDAHQRTNVSAGMICLIVGCTVHSETCMYGQECLPIEAKSEVTYQDAHPDMRVKLFIELGP